MREMPRLADRQLQLEKADAVRTCVRGEGVLEALAEGFGR
jgi:hypothetical protein